ncbi:VOC family protein [Streptomyces sp. KL116D]|uniref:VOC family protein n=1 Tax=Streptomyces sp. KL116D TaxID=3045152 RepID=UPI003557AB77
MTSRFTELTVDCRDPERLAAFWCEVLGFTVIERSEGKVEIASWEPTVEAISGRSDAAHHALRPGAEGRTVRKNPLHLDVSPIDCSTADER